MNILITSCGRRAYLIEYFKEALKKEGGGLVHASNADDFTPCAKKADRFVKSPLIYDEGYIDFIIDYCVDNEINAVISLFDIDLPVLAENRRRFEEKGIRLVVSSEDVVRICNDKLLTEKFCEKAGLFAPWTSCSLEETEAALAAGQVSFPVIIKARRGMGSLSMYVAEDIEELRVLYKKVLRGISSSYLKYEASRVKGEEVIFQEFIKGQEYGLDVVNDLEGKYVATLGKKKMAMRAGETDSAVTMKSEELEMLGKTVSEALGHVGVLDVDVIKDNATGKNYLIEMNARFGGGYPHAYECGVDHTKLICNNLKGIANTPCIGAYEEGMLMMKYSELKVLKNDR